MKNEKLYGFSFSKNMVEVFHLVISLSINLLFLNSKSYPSISRKLQLRSSSTDSRSTSSILLLFLFAISSKDKAILRRPFAKEFKYIFAMIFTNSWWQWLKNILFLWNISTKYQEIDKLTFLQVLIVKIQKYVFGQMLQSRVVDNVFHS